MEPALFAAQPTLGEAAADAEEQGDCNRFTQFVGQINHGARVSGTVAGFDEVAIRVWTIGPQTGP